MKELQMKQMSNNIIKDKYYLKLVNKMNKQMASTSFIKSIYLSIYLTFSSTAQHTL